MSEDTQKEIEELKARVETLTINNRARQREIESLKTELDEVKRESRYWEGHVLNLRHISPYAKDLQFQVTLSPILFYSLPEERRQQAWIDMIRAAWVELVQASSSMPKNLSYV